MITIKVFTLPSCPNCPAAKEVAKEVAEKFKGKVKVEELNLQQYFIDALQLGVASTPSVVVDNKVISRGDVPDRELLMKEIERMLSVSGGQNA